MSVSWQSIRYRVLLMLFAVTVLNYADRATMSIAGNAAAKEFGITPVAMGYVFSAFAWSYVIFQIPGGWLLDRYFWRTVYGLGILAWSLCTMLQGAIPVVAPAVAVAVLFGLRFLLGIAESPSFPGNSKIVAAWFPTAERGTAAAVFNSAQYFATVAFAPLTGWITQTFGWRYVFLVVGGLGLVVVPVWFRFMNEPRGHPRVSVAELDLMKKGGALMGSTNARDQASPAWSLVKQLLRRRMLLGVYLGQYCITALTYFFLTWFPVYLVEARGMSILKAGFVASLPALCGFAGGICGGLISDRLLRSGRSLSAARKFPIVGGMLLSMTIILCNYTNSASVVVAIMSLAFFGKGIGSLGWAVVSDTSPKEAMGLSGGLFNMFGNVAGITTPIAIGYIVQGTKSFNGALVFVAAHALGALLSYLLLTGEITRVELAAARPQVDRLQFARAPEE